MSAPWKVGEQIGPLELAPVDRMSLVRYAGASGDYNPIHVVDDVAKETGLPGIIQHGMLTMARMGTLLSEHLEHGFVEHFQSRFTGMLFLDEQLTIGGNVTAVEREGDHEVVSFDVYARTTEGRQIAKGKMRFRWVGG